MPPFPNFTAIELPGVLRDPNNPTRALASLGGPAVLQAYVTTPPSASAPRLTLNLRPSNTVSPSNITADPPRPTTHLFLIRLHAPLTAPDPHPGRQPDEHPVADSSLPEGLPAAADSSPPEEHPAAADPSPSEEHAAAADTSPPEAHPADADMSLPEEHPAAADTSPPEEHPADADASPPDRGLGATLVGRITAFTEFRALADFQYHPDPEAIRPYLTGHSASSALNIPPSLPLASPIPMPAPPLDFGSPIAPHAEPQHCAAVADRVYHSLTQRPAHNLSIAQSLDRLRPPRFARHTPELGASTYWYRQYNFQPPDVAAATPPHLHPLYPPLAFIPGRPLGEDRRSQPDRLARLPHRVSYAIDSVPVDAPALLRPLRRGRAAYAKLVALLRLLFQKRPVWVRRALLLGVPAELRPLFKRAIAAVAYAFQGTGAFFQACVRYGYDPRTDPTSRKYQVLEVRCAHPLHEAVRLIREQHDDELDAAEQPNAGTGAAPDVSMQLENQKAGLSRITLDLFQMPEEFILTDVPKKKNNFFQICDIKIESVIKEIDKQPMGSKYESKNGFFTEEGIQNVMAVMKSALFKLSEEVVGQKDSLDILKGDHRSIAQLRSKVRGRLHLVDVMKFDKDRGRASKMDYTPPVSHVEKLKNVAIPQENMRVTRSSSRRQAQIEQGEQNAKTGEENEEEGSLGASEDRNMEQVVETDHMQEEENEADNGVNKDSGFVLEEDEQPANLHHHDDGEDDDDDDEQQEGLEEADDGEELAGFEIFESDGSARGEGDEYLDEDDDDDDDDDVYR